MKYLILTFIIVLAIAVSTTSSDPIVVPLYDHSELESDLTNDEHTISTSDTQNGTFQKRLLGVLNLNRKDKGYSGAFLIGEPPKKFLLHIDTRSSMIFVPGKGNKFSQGKKSFYNPKNSRTARSSNIPCSFKTVFGGHVSGLYYDDKISVAKIPGLISQQQFCVVHKIKMPTQFDFDPIDGIIGFDYNNGFLDQTENPRKWTFFQTLFYKGVIEKGAFGIYFSRVNKRDSGSQLILGGIDRNVIVGGEPYYNQVISREHWTIKFDAINVYNQPVFYPSGPATIDTGLFHILAPINDARELYSRVRNSQILPSNPYRIVMPCAEFPSFSFTFNNVVYPICDQDMILGEDSASQGLYCFSAISVNENWSKNEWVLGISFLRNVYTEFDMANGLVGFGYLKGLAGSHRCRNSFFSISHN